MSTDVSLLRAQGLAAEECQALGREVAKAQDWVRMEAIPFNNFEGVAGGGLPIEIPGGPKPMYCLAVVHRPTQRQFWVYSRWGWEQLRDFWPRLSR